MTLPQLHPGLDIQRLATMDDCPEAQVDWLQDAYASVAEQPDVAKPSVVLCDASLLYGQGAKLKPVAKLQWEGMGPPPSDLINRTWASVERSMASGGSLPVVVPEDFSLEIIVPQWHLPPPLAVLVGQLLGEDRRRVIEKRFDLISVVSPGRCGLVGAKQQKSMPGNFQ